MAGILKKKIKYIFADIFKGKTPIYSDAETDYIVLGQKNNTKKGVSYKDCKYVTESFFMSVPDKEFLRYGDILINSLGGGTCGRVGIYDIKNAKSVITDGIPFVLRQEKPNKYLYYVIKNQQKTLEYLALGATNQVSLKEDDLKNLPIELIVDEYTQQKIAGYLDRKCGEIDSVMVDLQEQIDKLEQYKRSVISEAVTKGLNQKAIMKNSGIEWLGETPVNWTTQKAKYCFCARSSKGNRICLQLLSPTQKFGVIPQSEYEKLTTQVTVKVNEKTELRTFKTIHKGDFCISLRSFEGGFEYSDYEGVVSPAYTVFYPIMETDRRYYKYLFKTKIFIYEMNSYSLSLRDGKPISFDDFGNTFIPVPPLQEQREISDYLDEKCAVIESIIADKKQQLEVIEKYKKSLIYEYVTGKKEVVDE